MKPTPEQDKALQKIERWRKDRLGDWMFSLAGFAGTGKTSLLQHFISNYSNGRTPICCAPTGKAAAVLRSKLTGVDVKTVHQVLYQPTGKSLRKLEELEAKLLAATEEPEPIKKAIRREIVEEKQRLAESKVFFEIKPSPTLSPGQLVIVDESSMVSEQMRIDFEKTGCKALFVGDGGQLPPVNSISWFLKRKHDAYLNTVLRQALESPIVRLSMEIRAGHFNRVDYARGDCIIINKANVKTDAWLKADQILTGKNYSRQRINRFFRKQLGYTSPLPVAGEKMICLKNDHHRIPPWINGIQFRTLEDAYESATGGTALDINYDGVGLCGVEFYPFHCQFHYDDTVLEEPRESREGLFEADYAYAITVHKSQGSEWDSVIVADDQMQINNRDFRKRWLYTAVTRAKKQLAIII
jgi:exodeoxyribonuclease-5